MMLLLRGAIRHSATAAAKRSGDSRYKIEPRVQVVCHPFKQRLEPRVHLAGRKIPASTMSGKRPFPNHSSSSNLARAVCSDASTIQSTSSRLKLRATDRRCTDNGRPHRRNRATGRNVDPSRVIDADGTAYRGRYRVGLRRTPAQHSRKEPLVLLARCHLFGPCARSIVEGATTSAETGPIPRTVTKPSVSPMPRRIFSRVNNGGTPVDNVVLKLWNESRTNRARIADSSLVGFVHGNIS